MKFKLVILFIFFAILTTVDAQKTEINLSGTVLCEDSLTGPLNLVNVYNKNTKKGTVSDVNGKFSIKMRRNDTILFSTVQHINQSYYIKQGEIFHDKNIIVKMKQDTVWLHVVSVMGFKQFEQFKQEVLNLKTANGNDISLTLPVVNKYAKRYYSGKGAIEIKGPLTYLSKKILSIKKRRSQNNFRK